MRDNREKIVIRTSIISIISNIILAGFKAFVGLVANSIAIVSDAINNLSDALSSIITIVGTKLAGKAPDKKHPYGYGRIEYMTSLVVSGIVLYAGITALVESVKKVIHPEIPDYSFLTLIILIVGIIVKFILGMYVKKKGKEVNSDSLVASGSDAFNDAILSISVLVSAIIYLLFKISLEAYVGILLSVFIIKAGLELIKESVDNMLGVRVESSLAKSIKRDITKENEIQGAYDLILNDYGPDKFLGSVHIEVPDTMTVSEVDKLSRRITKTISEKYGVILHTIGVYSVNTKDKKIINAKKEITKIVFSHKGVLQMHGFYIDETEKSISFDIIIDFKVKNREEVYKEIYEEVKNKYKDYKLEITLDIDMSD
ncbi:MAG: cation transporter [Bacilli bacterium]|nr:cation transporter [Bacilli bacterium]